MEKHALGKYFTSIIKCAKKSDEKLIKFLDVGWRDENLNLTNFVFAAQLVRSDSCK